MVINGRDLGVVINGRGVGVVINGRGVGVVLNGRDYCTSTSGVYRNLIR